MKNKHLLVFFRQGRKSKKRTSVNVGFTLIELLVVIAILGLLLSIVLVATRETRTRGEMAAALQFAAQVHHALGADAIGIWDFDEGLGTEVKDSSGYDNNGTLGGGVAWKCAADDTPSRKGCSLDFSGQKSGDIGVDMGNDESLQFAGNVTICFWAKPNDIGGDRQNIFMKNFRREGGMTMEKSGNLSFYFGNSGCFDLGRYVNMHAETMFTENNKWVHVCAVRDVSNPEPGGKVDWYRNGQYHERKTYDNDDCDAGSSEDALRISKRYTSDPPYAGAEPFNGLIDDFRIYAVSLNSAQVNKIYAEGLKEHNLAEK